MPDLATFVAGSRGACNSAGIAPLRGAAIALLGALAVAAAAACGSGGGNGDGGSVSGTYSCTINESLGTLSLTLCQDASGVAAQQVDQQRQACVVPGGAPDAGATVKATFASAPCSHVGALGGCRIVSGAVTTTVWYYQNAGGTPAEIQMLCGTIGATFVPA